MFCVVSDDGNAIKSAVVCFSEVKPASPRTCKDLAEWTGFVCVWLILILIREVKEV